MSAKRRPISASPTARSNCIFAGLSLKRLTDSIKRGPPMNPPRKGEISLRDQDTQELPLPRGFPAPDFDDPRLDDPDSYVGIEGEDVPIEWENEDEALDRLAFELSAPLDLTGDATLKELRRVERFAP